jgi:hypothetical protein
MLRSQSIFQALRLAHVPDMSDNDGKLRLLAINPRASKLTYFNSVRVNSSRISISEVGFETSRAQIRAPVGDPTGPVAE